MAFKTLDDLLAEGVTGRHVLVRSDLNVPLDDEGNITDSGRITASLPTIKALIEGGAKVILSAHLGRPKGEVNPKYSLAPVAEALSEALGQFVALAGDVSGEDAHERANGLNDGDVLLLENVRFDARETSKDEAERGAFADELVGEGSALGLVLGGLTSVEADILQQEDVAVVQAVSALVCVLTGHIAGQGDELPQGLGKRLSDRSQGVLRVDFALRAAQVCGQDDLCATLDQRLDGRQRGGDTTGVGDVALIVQRDV